jgi:hypothetical protein
MLVGLRFGVPGLPCLSTTFGDDGTADAGGVGVLLVRFSNETSVPSAFLIVSLAAARGTNVREPTSNRLAPDMEGLTELVEAMLSQDYLRNVRKRREGGKGGQERQ